MCRWSRALWLRHLTQIFALSRHQCLCLPGHHEQMWNAHCQTQTQPLWIKMAWCPILEMFHRTQFAFIEHMYGEHLSCLVIFKGDSLTIWKNTQGVQSSYKWKRFKDFLWALIRGRVRCLLTMSRKEFLPLRSLQEMGKDRRAPYRWFLSDRLC